MDTEQDQAGKPAPGTSIAFSITVGGLAERRITFWVLDRRKVRRHDFLMSGGPDGSKNRDDSMDMTHCLQ